MLIQGSKILVTGASSGIGAALAPVLSARGATVGIVARRADRLAEVRADCDAVGGNATVWQRDLGDLDATRRLAAEVLDAWGSVDCIVNNAAIPKRVRATDLTMDELTETMRINFLSPAQLTLALLPHWLERGEGLVVNVSSMGGRIPIANEAAYNASKFALAGWSEALRIDLEGTGVDVKLVLPGPIATEIWDQPGNVDALFEIEKVPAIECATEIAEAIAADGFEYYTPPIFPGGLDAKQMVVDKTANCDQYLAGMGAFAAALRK
ncbi:MAG TPA: SDR family NAD(P)-dependent oxidoreductase [Acidimicrobiia bacterium]|jgi:short-subunit dehydrogenase